LLEIKYCKQAGASVCSSQTGSDLGEGAKGPRALGGMLGGRGRQNDWKGGPLFFWSSVVISVRIGF